MRVVEEDARPDGGRPPMAQDGAESADQPFLLPDLLSYVFVLRQHLLLFTVILVVASALIIFMGMRRDKVYRASTTVLISYTPPRILDENQDIYQSSHHIWEYGRYFETQPAVVTSRETLQEVARVLGLDEDDDFLGLNAITDPVEREAARGRVDAIDRLRQLIEVDPIEDSMTLRIRVSDVDPQRAADIADAVAAAYIDYNKQQRSATTYQASEWLEDRVGELREQLLTKENELLQFRRDNLYLGTSLEDSLNLTSERVLALHGAFTEKEIEYVVLRQRYLLAQEMAAAGDYGSIPEILDDATIAVLKQDLFEHYALEAEYRARYGADHPRLVQVESQRERIEADMQREIETILLGMKAQLDTVESVMSEFDEQLGLQQEVALDLNARETEFNRLERDISQTETLYTQVHDRLLQAQLQTELAAKENSGNISILDRATVPEFPFKPRLRMVLLSAVLLGSCLAVVGVFVIDRFDTTVRDIQQLEAEFRLPILGVFPKLPKEASGAARGESVGGLEIAATPRGPAAESCRAIRTNLMFMLPGKDVGTLLVTSAGPGEGKTSLAANLAFTVASAGKRVVLADTDMRRPRVHKVFGQARHKALSSVLVGEIELAQAISPSGYPNLDLLTLGNIPPNPAELLESRAFRSTLESLQAQYDLVILDSPPVIAVTDAAILSQFADAALLVVRHERTNRHVLRQALKNLRTVKADVVGFVVNDVDFEAMQRGYRSYRYSYRYPYYFYSYKYSSQYHDDDNKEEDV